MSYYLSDQMCMFYYKEIKKTNSTESDVDNFYNNLLPIYFPRTELYGIEQESRPAPDLNLGDKTDFTIRCIRNGIPKRVVIFECKRRDLETQSAEWRSALDQAIAYVRLIRTDRQQDTTTPIFIVVAIGTYLRAFVHNKGEPDAEPFHLFSNELLELAKDEEKVHSILRELNKITQH